MFISNNRVNGSGHNMGIVWKILLAIYLIGAIWLLWEGYNAPTYPDDYDNEEYL